VACALQSKNVALREFFTGICLHARLNTIVDFATGVFYGETTVMGEKESRSWHHRPAHVFVRGAMYLVTAGTLHKEHLFRGNDRLALVQGTLFDVAEDYGWSLQAWAVFSNHYHFIAQLPHEGRTLRAMIQRLHSETSRQVNELDALPGRQVWFQYWDTCLTFEKSYYARLNYVHNNAVKHKVVPVADQYPFCSAQSFANHADPSYRRKMESFRYDRVRIEDAF
jgi:putative transposase